jgi:OOP family OmpA-OmpF porin
MIMKRINLINIVGLSALVAGLMGLTACHGSMWQCGVKEEPIVEAPAPAPAPEPLPPPCRAEGIQVFYDTDLSAVTSEYVPAVVKLAECLSQNPDQKISIVGHADRRGTVQHNLILSQHRADGVRDLLIENKAPPSTITESVGVGKIPPLVEGRDPDSLAKNRTTVVNVLP